MSRYLIRTAAVLLAVALLSGCAWMRKKRTPPPADAGPLRLGRIALVNETERFALIETFSTATPNVGTVLRVYRGDAVSAELRATNVRRRPFLVADLVTGEPAKGDVVFQPQAENPAAPRAESAARPATPAPAPEKRVSWWRRLGLFGRGK